MTNLKTKILTLQIYLQKTYRLVCIAYKQVGTLLKNKNPVREDIKARISAENRGYYRVNYMFICRRASRRTELKLYKAIVEPIVVYGFEVWTLAENGKSN